MKSVHSQNNILELVELLPLSLLCLATDRLVKSNDGRGVILLQGMRNGTRGNHKLMTVSSQLVMVESLEGNRQSCVEQLHQQTH